MQATLQPESDVLSKASAELSALLTTAAVARLNSRAFLRVTGTDATRWLNGMVTNSIPTLQPGEGSYNFILNAQGRIQGDCTIYREPVSSDPAFLIETDTSQIDTIRLHLEHFIIMDDVELQLAPINLQSVIVAGPKAPELVRRYFLSFHSGVDLAPLRLSFDPETAAQITTPEDRLVPRIEIRTANANGLIGSLRELGATPVTAQALEHLRLLEGTPRYGTDIRNTEKSKDLPQETNQLHALNFSKGCYLGQEIVERIHSRGQVHRILTGLELTGTLPTPGATIEADGKPVGQITSAAAIPLPATPSSPPRTLQLALAYLRRDALAEAEAGSLTLTYSTGTAGESAGTATPIALPYPVFPVS
jgi:folate-binding protein YgfZ